MILLKEWTNLPGCSHYLLVVSMTALVLNSGCDLMLKPPPYKEHHRLVSIIKVARAKEELISGTDFLEFRKQSKTLGPIVAYKLHSFTLNNKTPERIDSALVSSDFFSSLGIQPTIGRTFLPEDQLPECDRVVILSYALWQRRFSGDPHLIGRPITLDQENYIVIGVMPPEFQLPKECGLWAPLAWDNESLRSLGEFLNLEVFARLKPDITLGQAKTEIRDIARTLAKDYPETNTGCDLRLTPLRESPPTLLVIELKTRLPPEKLRELKKQFPGVRIDINEPQAQKQIRTRQK